MYNISNFFVWFLNQFVNIGTNMINKIDNIILFGNISLLNFTITIALIGIFIEIIITVPKAVYKEQYRQETREYRKKMREK